MGEGGGGGGYPLAKKFRDWGFWFLNPSLSYKWIGWDGWDGMVSGANKAQKMYVFTVLLKVFLKGEALKP